MKTTLIRTLSALPSSALLLGLAAGSLAVGTARAQLAEAPQPVLDEDIVTAIQKEGLENSKVMEHLDYLTNTIGHRLTGSDNFRDACEWARGQFESWGLDARLDPWATWPVVWNRGQWHGRVVEPIKMDLQVATQAWTAGTKGRVRAPLLAEPTSDEEFEAVKDRIAGAWVLRRSRNLLPALAEFVEQEGIAGWVRSSSGDAKYPNRIRVFGRQPRNADNIPTVPDVVVRRDQFQELEELAQGEEPVLIEFDIRNRWRVEPNVQNNVVAEIRGTEKPDEYVVVCGHLDSWHQATGTTDNGTGSSTTLEAARILAAVGAKPKRSIRFMLWGGEEQGLLGSRGYVQRNRSEMDKVQIVFNHDTGTNWAQNLTVSNANLEALKRVFAPVMAMDPPEETEHPTFELEGRDTIGGGGGSDHASFLAARVPAFSWGLKGRVDYFGYTWHSQWDTYDVAVPEYQRHTATVIALAALGCANLEEKLSNEGVQPRSRNSGISLSGFMGNWLGGELGGEGDLVITKIKADGRASKFGLEDGDRLAAFGGEKLEKLSDLRLAMRGMDRDAKQVKLTVVRKGENVELDIPADQFRMRRRGSRR